MLRLDLHTVTFSSWQPYFHIVLPGAMRAEIQDVQFGLCATPTRLEWNPGAAHFGVHDVHLYFDCHLRLAERVDFTQWYLQMLRSQYDAIPRDQREGSYTAAAQAWIRRIRNEEFQYMPEQFEEDERAIATIGRQPGSEALALLGDRDQGTRGNCHVVNFLRDLGLAPVSLRDCLNRADVDFDSVIRQPESCLVVAFGDMIQPATAIMTPAGRLDIALICVYRDRHAADIAKLDAMLTSQAKEIADLKAQMEASELPHSRNG